MTYRIGIDAGSKTVKLVVLDEDGVCVHSQYRRHGAHVLDTLHKMFHDLRWRFGAIEGRVHVTGSAGISVARILHAPYVQEVMATTTALEERFPDADVCIEIGGEDAKIIYLTGGLEQRMNSSCAGGTGGFIDTIAFMLGLKPAKMSQLAFGHRRIHPIASRCAVFAQMDVRPLLNAGVSKADIAASVYQAIVKQTLGGLACGRPIRGKVVFLGGPFEYNPYLTHAFTKALDLDAETGVKPDDAHLMTALGAALWKPEGRDLPTPAEDANVNDAASDRREPLRTTTELEALVDGAEFEDDAPRLPPLFTSEAAYREFIARHERDRYPTASLFDGEGSLYLGIDAGSTVIKLAVIDDEERLVYADSKPSRGAMIDTVRDMLRELYLSLDESRFQRKTLTIAHSTATGYGEDLLRAGFGIDSGCIETVAHLTAARKLDPELTFLLDIGGQDMKALWVDEGRLVDAVLNEACSSGCGAFVEGCAYSLGSNPRRFSDAALRSTAPLDLGTRCTVFMTSQVRHAQKAGAPLEDIAAGVAYSVVSNALNRIIGADRLKSIGNHVVVQGGAFLSDAILRAFERQTGIEAKRPAQAQLMGAIGAALVARARARHRDALSSGLVTPAQLDAIAVSRASMRCDGCGNACALSVVDFGNGKTYVTGNRCERGLEMSRCTSGKRAAFETDRRAFEGTYDRMGRYRRKSAAQREAPLATSVSKAYALEADTPLQSPSRSDASLGSLSKTKAPNVVAFEQRLLRRFGSVDGEGPRAAVSIGLLDGLENFFLKPFWHSLLTALGFSVRVAALKDGADNLEAEETIPAESVCHPAKLCHRKAFDLFAQNVDAVLFPQFERNGHCPVASSYGEVLAANVEPFVDGSVGLMAPRLSAASARLITQNDENLRRLHEVLAPWAEVAGAPLTFEELVDAANEALIRQGEFEEALKRKTDEALRWLDEKPRRHGVVLAGRPYSLEADCLHDIDRLLAEVGFAVLPFEGFAKTASLHLDEYAWQPAKHLLRAAETVRDNPTLELVTLLSFGCGFDAQSMEDVRLALKAAGKTYTQLKIDSIVDHAHLRIRLRTLAEITEMAASEAERERPTVRETRPASPSPQQAAAAEHSPQTSRELLRLPLNTDDFEVARRDTVKDSCFTADALAARAIRLLRENPSIGEIHGPKICERCLVDALPRMVERSVGARPRYIWDEPWPANVLDAIGEIPLSPADDEKISMGIVGNPLLCFDPFMNDELAKLLHQLGARPVFPQPENLIGEDVRYLDQLRDFVAAGVRDVIYLQSFGCLKGHVQGRGALRELARRYPELTITVIDYDPEASPLNRENRVRLAVQTALKKRILSQ